MSGQKSRLTESEGGKLLSTVVSEQVMVNWQLAQDLPATSERCACCRSCDNSHPSSSLASCFPLRRPLAQPHISWSGPKGCFSHALAYLILLEIRHQSSCGCISRWGFLLAYSSRQPRFESTLNSSICLN